MSVLSRRSLLQTAGALSVVLSAPAMAQTANTGAKPVPVKDTVLAWLDGNPPARFEGGTLGVPWPRGTLMPVKGKVPDMALSGGAAVQSWPLAYWPDGSLKWTGHAISAGITDTQLSLMRGKSAAPAKAITVSQAEGNIVIASGDLTWVVPTSGRYLMASAERAGRTTFKDMELVALWQDQPDLDAANVVHQQRFSSQISKVTLEQCGPVRAVVRVEGTHSAQGRDWLPFSVRLYFYAGSDAVRIVHSFIYDGDPDKDFIRGLGVTAKVPMSDATHNRHIRLSGEGAGVWAEAVRGLTGSSRGPAPEWKQAQFEGREIPYDALPEITRGLLKWIPEWGDVSLIQRSADGFDVRKRTQAGQSWVESNAGTRNRGLVYAGGVSGGIALGLKDFWQRATTQLDVRKAQTDMAEVTAWLYSPEAPAIDVRSYRAVNGMDTTETELQGLDATYEDYQAGWDTPVGVARTSELMLWALGTTPTHQAFSDMAEQVATPARLVLSPERIQQCAVFGDWDVANSATPARKLIEDRLTYHIDYYMKEVEQRRWYGFWSYGDVMHSYDPIRHVWRYDVGGFAWANSELSPDLWIWYTYLRTGRADVFRFAEAMTRHTGEVDVYHLGRFKGFGTRHGVQHWSDSSKQPRVSTAAYRRIYYYLTADERVGDLMRDLLGSEYTLENVNIGRKLAGNAQKSVAPGVVQLAFGTSWSSFLAMWLTEWERTNDPQWRDRIVNGMTTIAALKWRWFASEASFDLKSGRFLEASDQPKISHLNAVFGAVEMHSELLALIDVPAYREAWQEYCRYYSAPKAEIVTLLGKDPGGRGLTVGHSRLTAYAAYHEKDSALGLRAWSEFFSGKDAGGIQSRSQTTGGVTVFRPIDEDPTLSTNSVSQWGLAAIQNLSLIGNSLDEAAHKVNLI
ncbi:MAG: Tat pathway signal sequence domain protein [Asticcacaulis sp.]